MLLIRFCIFSILFYSALNDVPKDRTIFIPPLKIPELLSSNFGELRIDHFHSGLDIKTQGVTGKEVVASANGYINRISISPGGFGNAIYIKHPSGYTTVYGHLDSFTPEIEKYVKERQYEKKSFAITLFPSNDMFPVKQGDIIAYSGNSGSSGGPHLHYEIRKSDNEKPINPMLFDFGIADHIKPVVDMLVIYPVNRNTLINKKNSIKKINVLGGHGNYYLPQESEISISGLAGFGIKAYDLTDDSPNRVAVYSLELSIDSISVFKYIMNGFSFNESRYVNSHIDYKTFMKDDIYIERMYVLPGDRLSVYKYVTNRGLFNFNDNKTHKVKIIITDADNNNSSLSFSIKAQSDKPQSKTLADQNVIEMPYNQTNTFSSENISINIPSGALYDTLYFSFKKEVGTKEMFSDLFYVSDKFTPVHKSYTLSLKPRSVPAELDSKMLIVQLDDDNNRIAASSKWTDGYLTADLLSFGRFYVGIDTVAPVISANGLSDGVNLTGKKAIKIKIKDDLSGIKSYVASIDGKWILLEYDQKNDLFIYNFDETRVTKGRTHNFSLKVDDNKDNSSVFNCSFVW